MLDFAGIVDSSTIDYPGKHAAVIYLCGCDFRCPFCHNREVVFNDPKVCKKSTIEEIVQKIKENYLVEAVVITGGEPLLQEESLELLKTLKNLGIKIKLDTNGSYPDRLANIINILDFISIDIKAPIEKYGLAIGVSDSRKIIENVEKSWKLVKDAKILKEGRTTIVPGINDSEEDIVKITELVLKGGFNIYTLQQFRPKNTLDPKYEDKSSPDIEQMRSLGKIAKKYLPDCRVRIATLEYGFEDIG